MQRSSTHWLLLFLSLALNIQIAITGDGYMMQIFTWQAHSSLHSGSAGLLLPLSSLYTLSCFCLVSGWRPYHTWGSSHGSTVPGWNLSWIHTMLPTNKTLLLARTAACASLCSSSSVCFQSSARPQYQPTSKFSGNWESSSMDLGQWWCLGV